MPLDINRQLERAHRSLEKNKLHDALEAYQAVYDEMPSNQEAVQALADICTRLNEPAKAAQYYGVQFDKLIDTGNAAKAAAIYARFLKPFPQPPDRLMRYAMLLQKQSRAAEAIEQFTSAAGLYQEQQRDVEALACFESIALLDPENPARHVVLAELAARLDHADLATRSYLRAGQLMQAGGALDAAIEYFGRAHELSPDDRSCALLYAEATLRKGDAEAAVALLEPFAPNEKDTAFLALLGESLLRSGRLDRAREAFEAYYKQKPDSFGKLFELAGAYVRAGHDDKAASVLIQAKQWMRAMHKEIELSEKLERVAAEHPDSLSVAETIAHMYEELNREAKYFDALMRLFDLYVTRGRMKEACEALDRLVDIDPYDYRNHQRIAKLEGKVDPSFLQNILARAAKAATVTTRPSGFSGAGAEMGAVPLSEEQRSQQALEDLVVQVEIFLQYALQPKAIERLERISELFPGEEEKNERLRALYERANWWPKGASRKPAAVPDTIQSAPAHVVSAVVQAAQPTVPVTSAAETHRDLAAIAEINRLMYRQPTPREVLATTAAEVGKHLGAARCLISIGGAKDAGQVTAEYVAPGMRAGSAGAISTITSLVLRGSPDALGGIELDAANVPALREMGVASALGVILIDKDTQLPAGAVVVADANSRRWRANESFFLQAVGDQLLISVNHTRLRSLVRSLAVADEKTGLLSRGAYIDCLLAESNRARAQGMPLSLIIVHIDHGGELLRQHGDAAVDQHIEQLARALSSSVRQTDLIVKYTAWSLAFILPDTSFDNAQGLAEKLRQVAGSVRPSWGNIDLTVSAVVAEASSQAGDETEDRVTEWINRAESGLDEARQRGGNTLVGLTTP